MKDHIIISNENVTDARVIGRITLPPDDELPVPIEDLAIVPDLIHEPDGWKITNFRIILRTQIETRPMDEILKERRR